MSLLTALERIGCPHLLVLGDLILDRYTWGDAERVSPEAPVLVLRADAEEGRPGGAASVAALLCALEATVSLAGVVGDDAAGVSLRALLTTSGVATEGVLIDPTRPTTTKERLMGRAAHRQPQQIMRVDREVRTPLSTALEQQVLAAILPRLAQHQAVLIADYAKGVCTPHVLQVVLVAARTAGIPVFVDPARVPDYERYRGATALTPNRVEAELANGTRIRTPEEGAAAADNLRTKSGVAAVVVKLDRDGMVLAQQDLPCQRFPTRPRQVYDVTGAGDMVLAMIGLCRSAGLPWSETLALANSAAGLEVERLGVAAVTRSELQAEITREQPPTPGKIVTLEQMTALAEAYREQGLRVVLTNGCFDLLHIGHVKSLQAAAALGNVLVVLVNSDASVRQLKGEGRPILPQTQRVAMLAALGCVDHVLLFEATTPHECLRRIRPDILVKGGTYAVAEVVGREIVEGYGGMVCVTAPVAGISTTRIVAALTQGQTLDQPNERSQRV